MARWRTKRVAVAAGVATGGLAVLAAVTLLGGRAPDGSPDGSAAGTHAGSEPAAGQPSAAPATTRRTGTARKPKAPAPTSSPADLDVRRAQSDGARDAAERRSAQLKARPATRVLARSLGAQGILDIDPLTGTPRQVERLDGTLTSPSRSGASVVALGYVRAHAAAMGLDGTDIAGLRLSRDYVDIDGTHHLSYTQSAHGLPLFGNGLKANVTKDGRLVNLTGSPVHALSAGLRRAGDTTETVTTPAGAVRVAKQSTGERVTTPGSDDVVTQVLFETASGPRRAWQVVAMSAETPALTVVDAADGSVLYRDLLGSDLVSAPTPYTAQVWTDYPQPAPAGPGGTAQTVTLTANNWLAAGAQALDGNNVHTFLDVDASDTVGTGEEVKPTGSGGYGFAVHPVTGPGTTCTTTICTWTPSTAFSWQANSNASRTATQNFYFANVWHDYLQSAPIGFTEAAGNFQQVNSSGQGKGGDAVRDEALSGASTSAGKPAAGFTNNADFATPPDGQAPTMRMFLFQPEPGEPFLPVAGSDSADIVYHEYTHGLSHRLVTDASNTPALDSVQGQSMGEAWSDWYGLDYLVNNSATTGVSDSPGVPDVVEGRYMLGPTTQTGIRSEAIDCPVGSGSAACVGVSGTGGGGYTYGDFRTIWNRTTGDVHATGEVWGQTLWDLRAAMITAYGAVAGPQRAEALVTRAMELSPTFPSMLDMRNAILAADQANFAGADVDTLWSVFAARGMGFFASSRGGDDLHPVEDFSTPPPAGSPTADLAGTVSNSAGGGPLAGIVVAISGHDSGFPGDYATTTDSSGHYAMNGLVPGTYPSFYVSGGVVANPRSLTVSAGANVSNWTVARDWAATSGGSKVVDFTGTDLTSSGCGPAAGFDLSQATGWASDLSEGSPFATVRLPSLVDVTTFSLDPSNTCGDGPSAGLKAFHVDTSPDGVTWTTAVSGSFTAANMNKLNVLTPGSPPAAVRWVRLVMVSPQSSGPGFVDMSELEVFGPQSSGAPRGTHQGSGPGGTVLGGPGQLPPAPR